MDQVYRDYLLQLFGFGYNQPCQNDSFFIFLHIENR